MVVTIDNTERYGVCQSIQATLAATHACTEDDLTGDGVVIVPWQELPGRLRFPIWSKPLLVVTAGAGVVVSCSPERLSWLRDTLANHHRDAIFSAPVIGPLAQYVARDGQSLAGPDLKYACSRNDLRRTPNPPGIEVSLVERSGLADLYQYQGFEEAISRRSNTDRPTMLAAVAMRAGNVVGIAAASADAEDLWQIGVAVKAAERRQGIARALVGCLSEGILARGKVPYYTAAVSNIASCAVAIGLGYWPAWTEMYARGIADGEASSR